MTDIVERLRHAHTRNLPLDDGLMGQAAAEIERLREEKDEWIGRYQAELDEIERLLVERDRLREALRDRKSVV
jgi:hypothetical protein